MTDTLFDIVPLQQQQSPRQVQGKATDSSLPFDIVSKQSVKKPVKLTSPFADGKDPLTDSAQAGLHVATELVPASIAGLAASVIGLAYKGMAALDPKGAKQYNLDKVDPAAYAAKAQEAFTFEPRTPGGKAAAAKLDKPINKVFGEIPQAAGEKVAELTDSPLAGAVTQSALQVGFGMGIAKSGEIAGKGIKGVAATDQEKSVAKVKEIAKTDPVKAREVVKEIAKTHPELAAALEKQLPTGKKVPKPKVAYKDIPKLGDKKTDVSQQKPRLTYAKAQEAIRLAREAKERAAAQQQASSPDTVKASATIAETINKAHADIVVLKDQLGGLDRGVLDEGYRRAARALSRLTDQPWLAAKFPASKYMTNSDGTPLVLLHGTTKSSIVGEITTQRQGFHAGFVTSPHMFTQEGDLINFPSDQPNSWGSYTPKRSLEDAKLYPVAVKKGSYPYLNFDVGDWSPDNFLRDRRTYGELKKAFMDSGKTEQQFFSQVRFVENIPYYNVEAKNKAFTALLKQAKIDGFFYRNNTESPRNYVSIIGNNRSQLRFNVAEKKQKDPTSFVTWNNNQFESIYREDKSSGMPKGAGAKQGGAIDWESLLKIVPWFKDSQVTYPVYHGTSTDAPNLISGREGGSLGNGIYFTPSPKIASAYANSSDGSKPMRPGANVRQAYVNIRKPLDISTVQGQDPMIEALVQLGMSKEKAATKVEKAYETKGYITNEVKSLAQKQGYDGIIQRGQEGIREIVVFNSGQVRSAISPEVSTPKLSKQAGAVDVNALTDPIKQAFKVLGRTSFGDSIKTDVEASIRQFLDHLNPAGRGDKSKLTESILAQHIAARIYSDEIKYTEGKTRADYFTKMGEALSLQFIKAFENRVKWKDPAKQAATDFYRKAFDELYNNDRSMGLDYDPVTDYFARIFRDGPTVEKFFQNKYGSKWGDPKFMKDRSFEFLNDALKSGYKLLTENPEELYQARVHASEVARAKIDALKHLARVGLARPISKLKGVKTKNYIDGADPIRSPTGELYYVEPTALPVLERAFDTNTLWNLRGPVGAVFRTGTALKNPMVGVDLGLSLFHATHVTLGMIPGSELTRLTQLLSSDAIGPLEWAKEVTKALTYGGKSGIPIYGAFKDGKYGNRLVKIFKGDVDPKTITPAEIEVIKLMLEGGFSPVMDAKYKGGWKESFHKAMLAHSPTALFKLPFATMEWASSWMTEGMIPSIKADQYVKGAKAWIDSNPGLANDANARGVALRALAKNIENRFGQMNYDTLFWNKMVKDVGIFSSLSMGWKLGFLREFVAGPLGEGPSAVLKAMQGKLPAGGLKGAISRGELNRTIFVANYIAMTMFYNALKTYANTGQAPQDSMDYVYPATGKKNPDGSKARESTPYYTREPVMIAKHMQNEGVTAGLSHYISGSAAPQIGMAWEFMSGLDYFGREISDPNAPMYKQLAQRLAHAFGEVKPMSIQAIQKQEKIDSKTVANAVFGFTPAPKYITESKLDGKITALYQKYNAKSRQPFESVEKGQERSKLRRLYLSGDVEGYTKLLGEMQEKYHLSAKDMKSLATASKQEGVVKMFGALTEQQQLTLIKNMSDEEKKKFLPKAHAKTKLKLKELEAQ